MNVLQHTRDELNLWLKQNRPDRSYRDTVLSVQHWDEKIELDQYCIEELRFWRTNLNSLKVKDWFLIRKSQRFVYSDASATGCGSVISLNEDHICHRLWEPSECSCDNSFLADMTTNFRAAPARYPCTIYQRETRLQRRSSSGSWKYRELLQQNKPTGRERIRSHLAPTVKFNPRT